MNGNKIQKYWYHNWYLQQFSSVPSMPTVKLVLRTTKVRADGKCPIWVRVADTRGSRYKSTGIFVAEKDWDAERQRVRKSHELSTVINTKLQRLSVEVRKEAIDAPSARAVLESVGGSSGSLTGYFEGFIERLDRHGRFWEWKKYRVTLGKLRDTFGRSINWDEIDRSALESFEHRLRSKYGNGPSTTRKELSRIRRVFNEAMRDGVIGVEDDPFRVYKMPKGSKPERRKLTLDEIRSMESLDLELGTSLRIARDVFLTAFYAGGMRFSDVVRLRPSHVASGRVEYRMLKTDTPISNPIPDRLRELLDPYIEAGGYYLFPLLKEGDERDAVHLRRRAGSKNTIVNRDLKEVATMAGIDPTGLSMHVARHSFADYARRSGGDLFAISKTLGHRDLATTQTYLASLDRQAVDKLAEDLWK